ncbi:hypothetical protein D3C80_1954260 [compost metagenome]
MCRLGVKANSVTELLRMRRLSSMVVSALVPSTWPTAVLIGPPLDTTSTFAPWCRSRTWSSAVVTPARKSM